MIYSVIFVFSALLGLIIALLPAGPDIPASAGELLRSGVAVFKSMDQLVNVAFELSVLSSILAWELGKGAFRAVEWAYKRVRG